MSVKLNANQRKIQGAFRDVIMSDGEYCKTTMVDFSEHLRCLMSNQGANCVWDSLELYWKLRKVGAKRVRGKRNTERKHGGHHYWVENKGMVFELHGGVQTIMTKSLYYKSAEITDVEVAQNKCFFDDELKCSELLIRRLRETNDDAWLRRLIDIYSANKDEDEEDEYEEDEEDEEEEEEEDEEDAYWVEVCRKDSLARLAKLAKQKAKIAK
jgi:hypothetical protein